MIYIMENLTASASEVLIDSLSFKLPSSGNVVDRRSCTCHTEGSNSYSANAGTKVIRFRLAGDQWLDPSTLRIMFDVVNNDANPATKKLRPIGRAHAFFRRLRTTTASANYSTFCKRLPLVKTILLSSLGITKTFQS